METERLNELRKLYSKYSDEEIRLRLKEGKDSYEPGIYTILCDEARKRSIQIPESEFSSEPQSESLPETKQASAYTERKRVFYTRDVGEANFIKSLLESSITDVYVHRGSLAFHKPFIVTVPENQEKEALGLLKEYMEKNDKVPSKKKDIPFTKEKIKEQKISLGITVFGWVLILFNGSILFLSISAFLLSMLVLENSVMPPSMPPFNSRGEYHLHLLWGLILYTPGFIGGIALLKLKEWGRKLVVIMSLGFTLCLLYKIVTQASYFKISTGLSLISTGLSLVFYVLIIYFFTRHSVKKQFKR